MSKQSISQWLVNTLGMCHDSIVNVHTSIEDSWDITKLYEDQKQVVLRVVAKLKEWIHWDGKSSFHPLMMTVSGRPGTGKSVVIKALYYVSYKIFGTTTCCMINAPTGGAAYNAHGKTCHRQWALTRFPKSLDLSSEKKKYIMKQSMNVLMLIIDEFSLLDAYTLGSMENSARQCVYSGRCSTCPWGSIPIIILFGDSFQLPSINAGVFDMMDVTSRNQVIHKTKNPVTLKLIMSGWDQFRLLSQTVSSLTIPKRVDESNKELLDILDALRGEDETCKLDDTQIQRLLDLNLNNNRNFTSTQQQQIKERSTCLFATKEDRDVYNSYKLLKLNQEYPICICPSVTLREGRVVSLNSHYDVDRHPSKVLLVVGAKVQLTGWNARPEWGLFHSALGIIKDIVFLDGESPNSGDFPAYVLVDFPTYKGPVFDSGNKTYVPISTYTARCKYNCGCTRTYVPLTLAFGKTIHSFQGYNVGPTTEGQPDNQIQSIVVDPGTRSFEARAPGLFFSVTSRVSTLGDPRDFTTSALFFTGNNMTFNRIKDITCKRDGTPYYKVSLRTKWVQHLKSQEQKTSNLTQEEIRVVSSFLSGITTPISPSFLKQHITKWCHHNQ